MKNIAIIGSGNMGANLGSHFASTHLAALTIQLASAKGHGGEVGFGAEYFTPCAVFSR